jgi:hypothetical protein
VSYQLSAISDQLERSTLAAVRRLLRNCTFSIATKHQQVGNPLPNYDWQADG